MNMKGWRTLGAAAALAALGVVQQSGLVDLVPPQYVGVGMMGLGFLMAYLRSITNTPVGKA